MCEESADRHFRNVSSKLCVKFRRSGNIACQADGNKGSNQHERGSPELKFHASILSPAQQKAR